MNTKISEFKQSYPLTVNSEREMWSMVDRLFPGDYDYDAAMSSAAGYPVYWSTKKGSNAHINDLNARFEIVFENYDCVNIWYSDTYWENKELRAENAKLRADRNFKI